MLRPCWLCFLSLISIVINNPPFSLQGMATLTRGGRASPSDVETDPQPWAPLARTVCSIRVSKVHQWAPPMFLCPREILRQVAMNLRCDLGHVT